MQRRKRGGRVTLICLLAAAAMLVVLTVAGTALHMRSRGLGLGEAVVSFISDTFNPGPYAPDRDA